MTAEQASSPPSHYDVAISFAGEDRPHAQQIADGLLRGGFRVFYDQYAQAELWGKDLYQRLTEVYSRQATYCVILLSANYKEKLWTRHELRAAQERAYRANQEYILPIRLDDTDVPGILATVAYLDLRDVKVTDVVDLLIRKLADNSGISSLEIVSKVSNQDSLAVPAEDVPFGRTDADDTPPPLRGPNTLQDHELIRTSGGDKDAGHGDRRWLTRASDLIEANRAGSWSDRPALKMLLEHRDDWSDSNRDEVRKLLEQLLGRLRESREYESALEILQVIGDVGFPIAEKENVENEIRTIWEEERAKAAEFLAEAEECIAKEDLNRAAQLLDKAIQADPSDNGLVRRRSFVSILSQAYRAADSLVLAYRERRWVSLQRTILRDLRRISIELLSVRLNEKLGATLQELYITARIEGIRVGDVPVEILSKDPVLSGRTRVLEVSPDRSHAVLASDTGSFRIWTIPLQGVGGVLRKPGWRDQLRTDFAVSAVAFDATSVRFTTLAGRKRLDVLRSIGGWRSVSLPKKSITRSLAASPVPGLVGVTAGKTVELWDVTTATQEYAGYEHPANVAILRFWGERDAVTVADDRIARLWRWDPSGERIIGEVQLKSLPIDVACDSTPSITAFNLADGTVVLWQPFADEPKVVSVDADAASITLSDDGQFLLAVNRRGQLWVWDPRDSSRLAQIKMPGAVAKARFIPKSWNVLTVLADNSLMFLGVAPLA